MLIIRTCARTFEHLLPVIREQEANKIKYMRDEDDGIVGRMGVYTSCVKRVYFDDGKAEVTFDDRTKKEFPDG